MAQSTLTMPLKRPVLSDKGHVVGAFATMGRWAGRIFILGLERYADLESLLAALRLEDIAIDELALQETDLEQVFLQIMGAGRPR